MASSLRKLVGDWLKDLASGASSGSALSGAAVKKNPYAALDARKIVSVGPKQSKLAPSSDYSDAEEFGSGVTVVILVLVDDPAGEDEYEAAVEEAEAIGRQIAADCYANNDLGGRVRDSLPGDLASDWTKEQGVPLAVANLTLHVNVAGQQIGG